VKQDDSDTQEYAEDLPAPANEQSLSSIAPGEIVIGILEGLDEQGNVLVNFAENQCDAPLVAISTVAINQQQAGQQVALLFAEGKLVKPVVMGLIHNPLNQMIENFEMIPQEMTQGEITSGEASFDQNTEKLEADTETKDMEDVTVDGKRVVIEGREEIVFKCGEASITLTKAGKILIRGKYLLNRSSGVNRIMGGSVQVN